MRGLVFALVGMAVMVLFLGIWYGTSQAVRPAAPVIATVPAAKPSATISAPPGNRWGILWVNKSAYDQFMHAYDERDDPTMLALVRRYEVLTVAPGTHVQVVRSEGSSTQVEVTDGQYAGRRGWIQSVWVVGP